MRSASILTLSVLAILLGAPVAPGAADDSAQARLPLCEAPVDVPAQGPSCPAPSGWIVPLADGKVVFTHGPDPLPAQPPVELPGLAAPALAASAAPTFPSAPVACVHDATQPHVQVVYARPFGGVSRRDTLMPAIVAGVHTANGILLRDALPHGVDLRFKVFCTPEGDVDVPTAMLPTKPADASFGTIISDLRALGYDNPRAKYWIVYDGGMNCGCGGQGSLYDDDRPGADNWNNDGGLHAISYVGNYRDQSLVFSLSQVMLHEAGHTMGAVQNSAPHASGAFHCTDGADVMCYNDGGPHASAFRWTVCPRVPGQFTLATSWPFDCGSDDYFHPRPAPGSYLDTHWNVGGPANRYLERVERL